MNSFELEKMYQHLVSECQSFEHKKEYVHNHPELYSPASLATLDALIERTAGYFTVMFKLHRNLLYEIGSRGVDDAFSDYGYVDNEIAQLFFQFATDTHVGITSSNIKAQNKLCNLDDSTKTKLINWFIAAHPRSEERLPYLKACIGL